MDVSRSPRTSGSGPRSLTEMCINIAIKNIRLVSDVGCLPSQYVSSIVKAVRDPAQLRALEENSDEVGGDIYEQTAEQWKRLIRQNYNGLSTKHNFVPEEPRHWHKVYSKYAKMQDEINARSIELLMNRVAEQKAEKESRRAQILTIEATRRLPVHRSQLQRTAPTAHWSTQPRPRQTFLAKAKRQAATTAQRFRQPTITPRVKVPLGRVAQAPEAMLNDARIQKQFDPRTAPVRIAPPRSSTPRGASDRDQSEREARLLQIKNKTANANKETVLSFDGDEDDDDDLFGDKAQDSSRQGILSVGSLEDIGSADKAASPSSATKRRTGLLSAAPGANRSGTATRPAIKPGRSSASPTPLRSNNPSTPSKTTADKAFTEHTSPILGATGGTMTAAETAAAFARRESSAQEAELARLAALRKRKAQPPNVFMSHPNKKRA